MKSIASRIVTFGFVLVMAASALGVPDVVFAQNSSDATQAVSSDVSANPVLKSSSDEQESRDLWVGETEVTDKVTSGKGWKYDAESNTLTIEDFENTKNDGEDVYCWHEGAGIYYAGDRELTIEAKGYNTVEGPFADESEDYGTEIEDGYGIRNEGKGAIKFVVRDGGSIEIASGKASLKGSFKVNKGLYVDAGSSITNFEAVKGFDPTTEVKAYEDEKSKYLWIAPKALHRVAVADSDGGYVMAVSDITPTGDEVSLHIFSGFLPDGTLLGIGYELDTLGVTDANGVDVPLTDVDEDEKSFTMPDSDVIVRATFKRKQYAVVVATTTHGSVSVDKTMAYEGETVTLSIQPDEGYAAGQPTFSALGVDDVPIIDNSFEMPGADVTVYVTFEKLPTSSSTTTSTTTSTPSTTTKSSGTSSGTTVSSGSNSGSSKTLASTGDPTSLATFTPIALIAGIAALGLRRRCM